MSIGAANKYQTHTTNATLTGTLTLTATSANHLSLDANGSARDVVLPDMGAYGSGTVHIDNTGGEVLTIKDGANSSATIGTPAANESATCYWASDGGSTVVANWICVVGAAN
tara:strand:- start:6022 stop:6357 length:336 start_codon:yes stop_codon:yes gene_type:complete